jgi:hypothetical protein
MDAKAKLEKVERVARLRTKFAPMMGDDAPLSVAGGRARVLKADPIQNLVVFTATTDDIDEDDEVVIPGGAKAGSYFFKNRSVFVDHRYDFDYFVGKMRYAELRPTKANATHWEVGVRLREGSPYSRDIMALAEEDGVGCSIGFERVESGKPTPAEKSRYSKGGRVPDRITREWDWVELSVTAIPMNPVAQSVGTSDARSTMLDRMLTAGKLSRAGAVAFGLPESPKRKMYPIVVPAPKRIVVRA